MAIVKTSIANKGAISEFLSAEKFWMAKDQQSRSYLSLKCWYIVKQLGNENKENHQVVDEWTSKKSK